MASQLPANVHRSTHPCLQAKLSQLRAATSNARETKALVHEIALIVGCEALAAGLSTTSGSKVSKLSKLLYSNALLIYTQRVKHH